MKRIGKVAVCFAGALALNVSLLADDVVLPGNPYAPVVERNLFGLNPVTVAEPTPPPVKPPVKITPNGIMTIFGQLQVLFKVAGTPERGKPAVEQSYILSEGQRQDDIEVTHIDEKKGIVTFNNHGLVQEIPLVAASATSAGSPPSGIHPINRLPPPMLSGRRVENRFGVRENIGRPSPGNYTGNNSNSGSIPLNNYSSQQQQQQQRLTPEEQVLMIEAERAHYRDIGSPVANLLPPTELTPQNTPATPK
ncbi:MAG: hypothetical protein ACREFE_14995 [Limisphaerales bacterium]